MRPLVVLTYSSGEEVAANGDMAAELWEGVIDWAESVELGVGDVHLVKVTGGSGRRPGPRWPFVSSCVASGILRVHFLAVHSRPQLPEHAVVPEATFHHIEAPHLLRDVIVSIFRCVTLSWSTSSTAASSLLRDDADPS